MRAASPGTRNVGDWPGPGVVERAGADHRETVLPVRGEREGLGRDLALAVRRDRPARVSTRRSGGRRARPRRTARRSRRRARARTPARTHASSTAARAVDVDAREQVAVAPRRRRRGCGPRGGTRRRAAPRRCAAHGVAVGDVEGRGAVDVERDDVVPPVVRCAARWRPTKPRAPVIAAFTSRSGGTAPTSSSAIRVHEKRSRRAAPCATRLRRRSSSCTAVCSALASASTSSGSTSSAASPTTSGMAPRGSATTGTPGGHRFERREAEALVARRVRQHRGARRAGRAGTRVGDVAQLVHALAVARRRAGLGRRRRRPNRGVPRSRARGRDRRRRRRRTRARGRGGSCGARWCPTNEHVALGARRRAVRRRRRRPRWRALPGRRARRARPAPRTSR